ncbi:MAG: lipoate--protein ligase family protein [Thermoplasmata archaeon]
MPDPPATADPFPVRPTVGFAVRGEEEFLEDERLLRVGEATVRVVTFADETVSYGIGVRPHARYLDLARSMGIPVVRRTSGGTGVLHAPGDLAWSVVLPRTDPRVGRDYVRGYGRLGAGVVRFLDRLGVSAAWVAPPNFSTEYCVLGGRGQVLSVGERVLGGAAQHLSRSALLHQGMLPLSVDRERVARLFRITARVLAERLTGLRELGVANDPVELARWLAGELADDLAGSA